MLKKVLVLAAIAFVVYYVLHNPQVAGHPVHVAGKNAWHGVKGVAASLAKFINTLVSCPPGGELDASATGVAAARHRSVPGARRTGRLRPPQPPRRARQ